MLVEGGIILMALRFRHRKGQERMPKQIHGNTRLEVGWTILPAVVIAVVTVPTIAMLWDLARDPSPDALQVTAEGHQWWWGFRYTGADMETIVRRPDHDGRHDGDPRRTATCTSSSSPWAA